MTPDTVAVIYPPADPRPPLSEWQRIRQILLFSELFGGQWPSNN